MAKTPEQIDAEIQALRDQRAEIVAEQARKRARDLETFENMSPAERRELKDADPEHWRTLMRQRTEAAYSRLYEDDT